MEYLVGSIDQLYGISKNNIQHLSDWNLLVGQGMRLISQT